MKHAQQPEKKQPARQPWLLRFCFDVLLIALWLCVIFAAGIEERSSELQAKYFSRLVQKLSFSLGQGASDSVSYPDDDLLAALVDGRWVFTHKDGRPY